MVRRRSLNKDKADYNQFRFQRDRHVGVSISNEFYQPLPFFFTRECSQLNLIGQYRGASAFMVCNGPSLGDIDLSLLKKPGIVTYGMNNGPKTFRPNLWTCVDNPERFIKSVWLDPSITKFVPHAHLEKPIFDSNTWEKMKIKVGECPNVVAFHRNEKFMANRFLFEDTINWGNHKDHGGGRSVMLPVLRILFLLGFRTVYMVGADFKMDSHSTYHFDEQRASGSVRGNRSTYNRLQNEYFPQLKPYFDAEGFRVFNCTPDSGLTVFPYKPLEEAIFESTAYLGNLATERTYGLYGDMSKRGDMKVEPTEEQKQQLAIEEMAKLEKKKAAKPQGFQPKAEDLAEFQKYQQQMIEQQKSAVPQTAPPAPQVQAPAPQPEAQMSVQQGEMTEYPQTVSQLVGEGSILPEAPKAAEETIPRATQDDELMANIQAAQKALEEELAKQQETVAKDPVYHTTNVEPATLAPETQEVQPAYMKDLSNMKDLVATPTLSQPVPTAPVPIPIPEPEPELPVEEPQDVVEDEAGEDIDTPFQSPFVDLIKGNDQ